MSDNLFFMWNKKDINHFLDLVSFKHQGICICFSTFFALSKNINSKKHTLTLDYFNYTSDLFTMRTRALGGSIPGPTYEIYPGDTFEITFDNRCKEQSTRETTI